MAARNHNRPFRRPFLSRASNGAVPCNEDETFLEEIKSRDGVERRSDPAGDRKRLLTYFDAPDISSRLSQADQDLIAPDEQVHLYQKQPGG